jgi:glycosyltransferase involved in cell wall biosynthesis
MNVLFLMFAFPDMNVSFNMYTSLVEQFQQNGHQVHVVAPAGYGMDSGLKKEKQIEVLRVKTLPVKNVPNYLKGISNIILPWRYRRAINKYLPESKYDLIILPTPPITLVNLAATLKKKHQARVYLILRDIFPQNAVDLDFMKKGGLLYSYFRAKEIKLYLVADHIGCMSPGNINYIQDHNPDVLPGKLHELKNYQILYNGDHIFDQVIKKKFNITGKFVVVFGGNMGKAQQLENVLELAKRCADYPDVMFLLLGEGVAIKKLALEIKEQKITNIRILGTIIKHEYQQLISVCDIGLISLHEAFTIPNIPSKTLDYFNVGLPVLASIDRATDYGSILEEADAGLWSYAGDHTTLKKNFDILYHNGAKRKKLGENGRKHFEKYLTPDIAYSTIISKLKFPVKVLYRQPQQGGHNID